MGQLCPLAAHMRQYQRSLCPHSMRQTFTFVFLQSITMAVTVSFGKPKARSICSIFSLCMESNALEKSTNKCCYEVLLLGLTIRSTKQKYLYKRNLLSVTHFNEKIFLYETTNVFTEK